MYTKLANSILTSTVWMESDQTRIVWLTLMAMCDKNGEVQASIPGLANVARVSVSAAEDAIQVFLSPDPYSRTKSDEGRRLEEIDGGWHLLNHEKYRDLASNTDQKAKAAERQKRHRERQKRNGSTNSNAKTVTGDAKTVTDCDKSHPFPHTDTDTDSDSIIDGCAIVAFSDHLPVPYQLIADQFVTAMGGSVRITAKRKTALTARWRDEWWRDNYQAALELACESPFLLGQNDRGWRMDFEFFCRPDSVTKILEGKYSGHQQRLTTNQQREKNTADSFQWLRDAAAEAEAEAAQGRLSVDGPVAGSPEAR